MDKQQLFDYFDSLVNTDQLKAFENSLDVKNEKTRLVVGQLQATIAQLQNQVAQLQAQVATLSGMITASTFQVPEVKTDLMPVEENLQTEQDEKIEIAVPDPIFETSQESEQVVETQVASPEPPQEEKPAETVVETIQKVAEKQKNEMRKEPQITTLNSQFSVRIERLQSAITILDRFRFQRELFGNSAPKMNEEIEKLNEMTNIDEALAYIEHNLKWNMENAVVKDFINILQRKF
ncbi:MAG: hypothetical protein MJZ93_03430 [Paludibacteraceae bacterium]|nr:hypothetical protein [Paludibacteraceae bacterium]